MKIILLQSVPKLGNEGEIKDVAEGYFRNLLLPRKLAEIATPSRIARAEAFLEAKKKHEVKEHEKAKEWVDEVGRMTLTLTKEADEKGTLYAAVSHKDIASLLKEKGIDVPEKHIQCKEPIKTLGEHSVVLKFEHAKEVTLKVVVARK